MKQRQEDKSMFRFPSPAELRAEDLKRHVEMEVQDEEGELRPGDRLGRYELTRLAARGGMGTLWAARQVGVFGFEKVVAIKTMLPRFAHETYFRDMFLTEAKIAAAIDHPNVGRIIDFGESRGLLYSVTEWIDGYSLAELGRQVVPIRDEIGMRVLLRIVADTCAGLHAAHELRDSNGTPLAIVHRDVSPGNILIDRHGVARLIDFGLATPGRAVRVGSQPDILKGKIAYMAPEYLRSRHVDRRSDLWAIGVILHGFLAGRAPISKYNAMDALRRTASGAPLAPLPTRVPLCITAVVDRLLSHDPDGRFSTAADVQNALEGALVEMGAPTTSQTVAAFVASQPWGQRDRSAMVARDELARRERDGEAEVEISVVFDPGGHDGALAKTASGTSVSISVDLGTRRVGRRGMIVAVGLLVAVLGGVVLTVRSTRSETRTATSCDDASGESRPSAFDPSPAIETLTNLDSSGEIHPSSAHEPHARKPSGLVKPQPNRQDAGVVDFGI